METETLVPQQEQTTEEDAPALLPWTTPRLQRLNQAANKTDKNSIWWESTFDNSSPGTAGPS